MDRLEERKIILRRFFFSDKQLYQLGRLASIDWFNMFERKFSLDQYAYFAEEERREALERVLNIEDDAKFIEALNDPSVQPKYIEIDRFIGEHYFYDRSTGFELSDKRNILRKEVQGALEETKGRGYFFLKAIIDLEAEGKWDRAYDGATWVDILFKVRQLKGSYPSPRDLAILRSYKIYYKTGSRRYPTHTVPREMMPTINDELEKWKRAHENAIEA
jgi:hypothetical protein